MDEKETNIENFENDAKSTDVENLENEVIKNEFENSPDAKWYALHTFSGYENIAKENLETVKTKFNLENRIFDIIIPMETVLEEKNGKKKLVERRSMPTYIFVKMIYGDDLWHNVTRTRGVTGFVGPNGRPLALTEEEVMKNKLEKLKIEIDLEIGDLVEVIDGALEGSVGKVSAVNPQGGTATIIIEMFGRETEVDVQTNQVRKA